MTTVSQRAINLIVAHEVIDEATYTKRYTGAAWPGGGSGVTIGIGYDLGQVTRPGFTGDWQSRLPEAMVALLAQATGVTGQPAHALAVEFGSRVAVDWATANDVFTARTLPSYVRATAAGVPNTEALSPDSFGALVSLVYNRGACFAKAGDRYTEMRAIKAHMAAKDFAAVAGDILAMQRLWPPATSELAKRRRDEAQLFTAGLT